MAEVNRRHFLGTTGAVIAGHVAGSAWGKNVPSETVNVVYRLGDEHQAAAIASLRHVLRDHRNGEAHDIDLALYDQL